jgi:hypothetical protein
MRARRGARALLGAFVGVAALSAPAFAVARHDVARHPAPAGGVPTGALSPDLKGPVIGYLAYVTPGSKVKVVSVARSGNTTHAVHIGPIAKVSGKKFVDVSDLVASGDGDWVAWQELVEKPSHGETELVSSALVLRNLTDGSVVDVDTSQTPVGFSGDQLVTEGGHAHLLDLYPSPHFEAINDSQYALAAYPDGVVDTITKAAPPGPDDTVKLRLTAFDGTHTVLHRYVLDPSNTRIPDRAWVSGDGTKLLVERGDHTDFGGVGPSSLADQYALDNGDKRKTLGHFGSDKDGWRMGSATFAWSGDQPWALWQRATKHGAKGDVAVHEHGKWVRIVKGGIAAVGDSDGYVIAQPGTYVPVNAAGNDFEGAPDGDALMTALPFGRVLGIEGTAFAWVTQPAD